MGQKIYRIGLSGIKKLLVESKDLNDFKSKVANIINQINEFSGLELISDKYGSSGRYKRYQAVYNELPIKDKNTVLEQAKKAKKALKEIGGFQYDAKRGWISADYDFSIEITYSWDLKSGLFQLLIIVSEDKSDDDYYLSGSVSNQIKVEAMNKIQSAKRFVEKQSKWIPNYEKILNKLDQIFELFE